MPTVIAVIVLNMFSNYELLQAIHQCTTEWLLAPNNQKVIVGIVSTMKGLLTNLVSMIHKGIGCHHFGDKLSNTNVKIEAISYSRKFFLNQIL